MDSAKENLTSGATHQLPASGNEGGTGFQPVHGPAQVENLCHQPGAVSRGLGLVVSFALVVFLVVCVAGLTEARYSRWTAMILGVLALWAAWLFWRLSLDDHSAPVHVIHLALAVPVLILLGHLLAGARLNPRTRGLSLLADNDTTLLIQLLTLSLMVALTQDVLSRIGQIRWPLTALGLAAAGGAVLRLYAAAPSAPSAVALSGYAGVGMLLAPCWLPPAAPLAVLGADWRRWLNVELVLRGAGAAALAALLMVAPSAMRAGIVACAVVGSSMLLAGCFLSRHRASLLLAGLILLAGGLSGIHRAGIRLSFVAGGVTWLGQGQPIRPVLPAGAPGLQLLADGSGWLGAAALTGGMLATLIWGLAGSRRAARGDQARVALWVAVVALAGCALLSGGGFSVPATAAVSAVAWGLMPHVMAQRVRRSTGILGTLGFLAVLVVLGLEQRLAGSPWIRPLLREGDALPHFAGSFLLACVLFWQFRCRRWWQALPVALLAVALGGAGELAQKYLSTRAAQLSDLLADALGAASALAVFLLLRGLQVLERALSPGVKPPYEKYQPWRS